MGKEEILLCLVLATNAFRNLFCEKDKEDQVKVSESVVFYAKSHDPWQAWPVKREHMEANLLVKTLKLFDKAGAKDMIEKGDKVAIKVHVGEAFNYRYLRPEFVACLVRKIKEYGGRPFLTDTTGLGVRARDYGGGVVTFNRRIALNHIEVARSHGYCEEVTGAPFIPADGMYGLDGLEINLENALRNKRVFIAKLFVDADKVILATHFKGHGAAGFGGSLKNLGVGCVTKTSKWLAHCLEPPEITEACNGCGDCIDACLGDCITIEEGKAVINYELCVMCGGCMEVCKEDGAIKVKGANDEQFSVGFADNARGVIGAIGPGNLFYFNFALDIVSQCDCYPVPGTPIVPDIGVFASKDPVAIDRACVDAVISAPGLRGSPAEEKDALDPGVDKFVKIHDVQWKHHVEASERLGVGSQKYELKEV